MRTCTTGNPLAKRNLAAYFRSQMLKPYLKFTAAEHQAPGDFSPMPRQDPERNTVLRRLTSLLHMRARRGIPDVAMDDVVRGIKLSGMGGACFPNTWDVVRKSLTVPDASLDARHVCTCCGYMWAHLPEGRWADHLDDRCPTCFAKRFNKYGRPRRRCFVRNLQQVIEDMLTDTDLAREVGKHRSWGDAGTFWNSPAARTLDRCCRHRLSGMNNGLGTNEIAMVFALGASWGLSSATSFQMCTH